MSRYSLLSGVAAVACVLAVSSTASARTVRDFDIAAGTLQAALATFAVQSDQQILFTSELVAGQRSAGVSGRMEPGAALDRLLEGSGLVWTQSRPGVFALTRARIAETSMDATELQEVVVTGSLLKTSGELASPVLVIDRDALDRRGLGTVAETLADLPQNYAGSGTAVAALTLSDGAGSNASLGTGVNLRGLGPSATLVLVNGRRLAGTGFRGEFADVSALPSAAVQRVDVLLDGASALYGSDAVAGVVNVIMRQTFDGQEGRVRLSAAADGAEDVMASYLAGTRWTSGSALISYEYQKGNGLNSGDRSYTRNGDLRAFGGSDRRGFFSGPGNLLVFDPFAGGYVSGWAIRPGASGAAQTPADFAAGQTNLQAQLLGVDLTPDVERHSVYARARQTLGDRIEFSADVRFSQRDFGFDNASPVTIFNVTAANPFFVSPDGSASHLIGYSFFQDLGTSRREGRSRSLGITAGGAYDLGGGWSVDGYLSFAEERGAGTTRGLVNSLFLNEALGNTPDNSATAYSVARDGYFNPYGAGAANTPTVLDFIGSGMSGSVDRSRAESANLLVSGPVMALPGGDLELAIGAQARRETFATSTSTWTSTLAPVDLLTPERERNIAGIFAEARIPLVGPANARSGVQRLDLSLAGRVEHYDDFGDTSNPKIGLVWAPAESLALKATWGTSFRAPALPELFDASAVTVTTAEQSDGSSVLAIYRYGGNPDLEAEKAKTWTVGFDYSPKTGPRISVNAFDTRFTNRISQPVSENFNAVLTDPALAPFVRIVDPANSAADLALIRSYTTAPDFPYGSLFPDTAYGAVLDARWVNAAAVEVRGLDATVSYPISLGGQALTLDASGSYIFDYDTQTTALSPARSVIGDIGYPVRVRARAGGSWSYRDWTVDLHWNHVGGARDGNGTPIDAWDTADLQLNWSPTLGALAGTQLSLTALNLFDTDPPFYDSPAGFGFDPGQSNPFGRTLALQLIRRW